MKTPTLIILSLLVTCHAHAQQLPSADAINGVKGVKQEAVTSIKKIAPPTVVPVTPPPPTGVTQPVPPPPPPPPIAQAMNKVDGIQATPPNTVKGVPPPPAAAISTIRAVQGAAAALLNGPKGLVPAPPAPNGDGRGALQEFEKLDKPGS